MISSRGRSKSPGGVVITRLGCVRVAGACGVWDGGVGGRCLCVVGGGWGPCVGGRGGTTSWLFHGYFKIFQFLFLLNLYFVLLLLCFIYSFVLR